MTCSKCGKKGHYSSQCKSKPKVAAAEVEKESTEGAVATNGAISFGFYAILSIISTSNRFEELANLPQESAQTVAGISTTYRKPFPTTTSTSPRRRNTRWSRRGMRKASYPKPKPMPSVPAHLMETLTRAPCRMTYSSP